MPRDPLHSLILFLRWALRIGAVHPQVFNHLMSQISLISLRRIEAKARLA
jgi:hypothetical protein